MRTLDPLFTDALQNNTGNVIIRAIVTSSVDVETTYDVLYYEIKNLHCKVVLPPTATQFTLWTDKYVQIQRGYLVDDQEFTVTSSKFYVEHTKLEQTKITLWGTLLSNKVITNPTDGDSAEDVIERLIEQTPTPTLNINTVQYGSVTEWWRASQFIPEDKSTSLQAQKLPGLLQQKYVAFMFDRDDNIIRVAGTQQYFEATPEKDGFLTTIYNYYKDLPKATKNRYFTWQDENESRHYLGTSTDPLHNLGYITEDPTPLQDRADGDYVYFIAPPDLELQPGDIFNDGDFIYAVDVEEYFDPGKTPSWYMVVKPVVWTENTEGGALPSTIERISNFTPLQTTGFTRFLSTAVNNLQAFADWVNDKVIMWTGNWSGVTAYKVNDIVYKSGVAYICILAHTNHTPPNATYWQAVVGTTAETNTSDIFRCDSPGGASAFVGTINGAPSGASVAYNVTSGQEAAMKPNSASQLGKLRLYNTTRGNSALISDCNTGTNTITLTANAPANWANGDTITITSQTVSGGGFSWVDVEITSGPTSKAALFFTAVISSATVGDSLRLHPTETFGAGKIMSFVAQAVSIGLNGFGLMSINSNVFSLTWTGTPTVVAVRESGYLP